MTSTTLNLHDRNVAGWIQPYLARMAQLDYTVLCLFYSGNGFAFDETEADRLYGKKLVILEMMEYGWDRSWPNINVMGSIVAEEPLYPEVEEYQKLCAWIDAQKVITYFKREMTAGVAMAKTNFPIHPIDLLSFNRGPVPTPRREEFLARKGGIFYLYGNSHPDRLALHGALQTVRNSASNSIGVAQRVLAAGYETDLLEQVHFAARYPLEVVIGMQGNFKVSVSLGGAGVKTFRHAEACVNCVPVINDVGMIYAVEWNAGNAIMLPAENGRLNLTESVWEIEDTLKDPELLWMKMQGAHQAALELEPATYIEKHINSHIRAAL